VRIGAALPHRRIEGQSMNMTGKCVVIAGSSSGLRLALTQILAALDDRFVSFKPALEASVTWPQRPVKVCEGRPRYMTG
jgi:hypothetical protein